MERLYHRVPPEFRGPILHPLNELKNHHPDLYEVHAKKYEGREDTMEIRIPPLNCLWNDVLHFSAVHPREIKEAMIAAGIPSPKEHSFFEIDPLLLDPEKMTIFVNDRARRDDPITADHFVPFDPENLAHYAIVPDATKRYYEYKVKANEPPLVYARVPHIFYRGSLDVSSFPIITP